MDTPWYGIVLAVLGLVTLWLAIRGPKTETGEGTEVGLLAMLPESAWRAFLGVLGIALIALGIGTSL